jgi:tRNA(adenine34) deaminase
MSHRILPTIVPAKGDVLTEAQLDDAVHAVQLQALGLGMIPIAGIMSKRLGDGRHEVVGFGWNHLREGIPGIHGETGAIMNMGRREDYGQLVATSSLSPCPFCQNTLACQLGIKEVRVLDVTNYKPDFSGYAKVGLSPSVHEHAKTIETFRQWVTDPANATIWNRDIGVFDGHVPPVFDVRKNSTRIAQVMAIAQHKAHEALHAEEAPIGAVVIDALGEVIGAGHSEIISHNDPSRVAAMSAWRACGAREHWMDKTLVLTCGPDHIAYSMFHIFRFGQLVIASDAVFAGQTDAVRRLGVPVHVQHDTSCDEALKMWVAKAPKSHAREYLGSDYSG